MYLQIYAVCSDSTWSIYRKDVLNMYVTLCPQQWQSFITVNLALDPYHWVWPFTDLDLWHMKSPCCFLKKWPKLKFLEDRRNVTSSSQGHHWYSIWVYIHVIVSDYSFEREHAGLRRIAGYGVTVTRGAASVMMFTYASLLVTMSRNTITFLRETFLHRFIPFDSAHAMHKIVAIIALLFTGT